MEQSQLSDETLTQASSKNYGYFIFLQGGIASVPPRFRSEYDQVLNTQPFHP